MTSKKTNNYRKFPGTVDALGNYHSKGGAKYRPDNKVTKQKEAIERNEAWKALSTKDKLKELKARPGECRRQITRLNA
jgi:hypothetical protein